MAKVILIYPCCSESSGSTSVALAVPPLGLAYLGAFLREKNHKVQIIDANLQHIFYQNISDHFSFDPDIVGFSANILTYKEAIRSAAMIRSKYKEALIVLGGPHASTLPEYILKKNNCIDAIVRGEGEESFLEIADSITEDDVFKNIKGVGYRKGADVIINERRPLLEDLDQLPFPAYDLLPPLKKYKSRSRSEPVGHILTSRGCPARCTYCYRTFGFKWREFSPQRVIDEIVFIKEKYHIKQLDILDDNFTFNIDRASQILDMIIEKNLNLKINLQIGIRVDRINEGLLKKMKKAGVFKMGFGVESGDVDVLKRIKKGIQLRKAEDLVKTARSLGITTHGYFMIGFPFDTKESIRRTIEFAIKLNPHYASFSVCTPLPGTELFDSLLKEDKLLMDVRDGIDHGLFSSKVFFRCENLKEHEIVDYFQSAWSSFYRRPSKILDVLGTIRSQGEFSWLVRVLFDMIRTKRTKKIKM